MHPALAQSYLVIASIGQHPYSLVGGRQIRVVRTLSLLRQAAGVETLGNDFLKWLMVHEFWV